jgi:hypothetical protein
MSQAQMAQWTAQIHPAIGEGGRLPRKVLIQRSAVALGLILLLGLAKPLISPRESWADSLSALPGGRSMATGLYIGGVPSDYDLQTLATVSRVDGVANLAEPSVVEQVTATSLHQGYLYLAVPPVKAPTWNQLRALASFMRGHTAGGASVYVHDDVGGGRAVVTSDMLLLLRGEPWSAVSRGMTTTQRKSLSDSQLMAIGQLISALHSRDSRTDNPYSSARVDPW